MSAVKCINVFFFILYINCLVFEITYLLPLTIN